MKKISLLGLMFFMAFCQLIRANAGQINAETVNVTANTVNITPSLSEQALIQQYRHPWWINVGGGLTTGFNATDSVYAGYDVSANVQPYRHQVATLRSSGAEFIGGSYYDIGLMYGLISRNQNGYISASTGISGVFFERDFLGRNDNTTVLGLPFEMQAFWTPVPNFGLGLIGYVNANEKHSYYGMVLALQLANLVPF